MKLMCFRDLRDLEVFVVKFLVFMSVVLQEYLPFYVPLRTADQNFSLDYISIGKKKTTQF